MNNFLLLLFLLSALSRVCVRHTHRLFSLFAVCILLFDRKTYIDIVVTIYSVLRGKKKREKRLKDALSTLHNTQHTRQQVFYAWKQETHIDLVFITGET